MFFRDPEDRYNSYKRFLKKGEYRRAYRSLEGLLHEFPDDEQLLEDMVNLCIILWERPDVGRPWLLRLVKLRGSWLDYAMLGQVEAELGKIEKAKEYLKKARQLYKEQPRMGHKRDHGRAFSELEMFIKHREWELKHGEVFFEPSEVKEDERPGVKKPVPASSKQGDERPRVRDEGKGNLVRLEDKLKELEETLKPAIQVPSCTIPIKVGAFDERLFEPILKAGGLQGSALLIDYEYMALHRGFDELLCLNAITGVERYWYQIETVKKVLRQFHGRVLLSDEVGLGKTIEAGMIIKEYLMRGMVKNVLILVPPSLVSQWQEEMLVKFGISFFTTSDIEFLNGPVNFWKQPFIIASVNTAKGDKYRPIVTQQFYDLIVVDEAHHLRNRKTLAWRLVNEIKKRFILLLTATPIQNNLIELFNLITLLKPGQFRTEKEFKREYLKRGSLKATADRERLRDLLKDVMIRNTRSAIDIKLPKRFAHTMRLEPGEGERKVYAMLDGYLRGNDFKMSLINLLLREAESSPFALRDTLINLNSHRKGCIEDILGAIETIKGFSKGDALIEILKRNRGEKKVVFTQFAKTMDYITHLLRREEIESVTFRGDMRTGEKDSAISAFRDGVPVLVSTESGGEGRNLQFCNTIINFDLPWNPMRIEQRVGRLHRIGQKRDVFIFNLSVKGTVEDYIIEILDSKINMFEMVIGEVEPILGYLGEDVDFEDLIMDIWLRSSGEEALKQGFAELGMELVKAKERYLDAKVLDEEVFGEDYEI